ncbi:MAG: DNA polymerase III subunit gamma and tau [Nocardioides sp.]
MESPLALYRRYRPETFAEVIGQDHVTEPLRAALAHNRVNHAYLFSGPRGCGKTTSARILARSLNCELAPVADPCGECRSCRDLARGGPGSIDVIEIDAASHGGVDDARDLREKAFFAPVASTYKVYIIDEAHMVSSQGFNALLKLVEEPPPHLRFIFATTEPEKVLPTIRSRTHHYPFRLIPPRLLSSYLSELCEKEGVAIEPAALPLVVRAGAGSARDTLSVLDQLMGGAGEAGVTHALATGLLGYTPDTLLDEVVDAFAAGDGAAVFGVVDKVIETGQDPRRFAEDLLRRLRDLVIMAAVPDAPASGLIDVSEDQGERLVAQAARFGGIELSRAADLVATALTEMRGATAPRLLLELVCARVLLPGADHSTDGLLARLDRLERRIEITGTPVPSVPEATAPSGEGSAAYRPLRSSVAPGGPDPTTAAEPPAATAAPPAVEPDTPAPEAAPDPEPAPEPTAEPSGLSLVDVRRLWPDIVEATKMRRRLAWMHLTQNSQVVSVEGALLTLGFTNAGARDSFLSGGCDEILRQAAIDVVGADWKIETLVDPGAQPAPTHVVSTPSTEVPATASPEPASPPAEAPDWARDEPSARPTDPESVAAAREAIKQTRPAGNGPGPTRSETPDEDGHPDDPNADTDGLDTAELLRRTLGAEVIDEVPHS